MISDFVDRKAPTLLRLVLVVCVANAALVLADFALAILNHIHHGISIFSQGCR